MEWPSRVAPPAPPGGGSTIGSEQDWRCIATAGYTWSTSRLSPSHVSSKALKSVSLVCLGHFASRAQFRVVILCNGMVHWVAMLFSSLFPPEICIVWKSWIIWSPSHWIPWIICLLLACLLEFLEIMSTTLKVSSIIFLLQNFVQRISHATQTGSRDRWRNVHVTNPLHSRRLPPSGIFFLVEASGRSRRRNTLTRYDLWTLERQRR